VGNHQFDLSGILLRPLAGNAKQSSPRQSRMTTTSRTSYAQPEELKMRYAIFLGALIVSLDLLGASIANAVPVSGNAIVNANSRDLIPVMQGCGAKYKRNKQTGQCEPF
jgi:hypothetical protein